MKKIFTILCFALMAVAANAQKLQVMKDGKVMAEFYGKDGWEFVFDSDETPGTGNMIGGHEYVEIGGVKWATMNIGATTVAGSYETCYGDWFALGEASPRYDYISRKSATDAKVSWKFGYPEGYSDTGKKGETETSEEDTTNEPLENIIKGQKGRLVLGALIAVFILGVAAFGGILYSVKKRQDRMDAEYQKIESVNKDGIGIFA